MDVRPKFQITLKGSRKKSSTHGQAIKRRGQSLKGLAISRGTFLRLPKPMELTFVGHSNKVRAFKVKSVIFKAFVQQSQN